MSYLRPLTYMLGCFYPAAYTRRPSAAFILYVFVHFVMISTIDTTLSAVVTATWSQWMDYVFWSTISAFAGAMLGWLLPFVVMIPAFTAVDPTSKPNQGPPTTFNVQYFFTTLGMLVLMWAPFVAYDLTAWAGTWYSYVVTGAAMTAVHLGCYFISTTIPFMQLAENSRKLHLGMYMISIILLITDGIFELGGLVTWPFYVPLIIMGLIVLTLLVTRLAGLYHVPQMGKAQGSLVAQQGLLATPGRGGVSAGGKVA